MNDIVVGKRADAADNPNPTRILFCGQTVPKMGSFIPMPAATISGERLSLAGVGPRGAYTWSPP